MKTFKQFMIEKLIAEAPALFNTFPTLGIEKESLPQFKTDDEANKFIDYVKSTGTRVRKGVCRVCDLRPSQSELDMDYVSELINSGDIKQLARPIVITSDSYILDGHHRWAALTYRGDVASVPVRQLKISMEQLLKRKLPYDPSYIPPGVDGSIQEEHEHQEKFKELLTSFGVESPDELSDEDKKDFFNQLTAK